MFGESQNRKEPTLKKNWQSLYYSVYTIRSEEELLCKVIFESLAFSLHYLHGSFWLMNSIKTWFFISDD